MNRISKYLFGAAALALLAGCSDEIVPDDNGNGSGNGTDDGPGLYIGVNFSLPGAGQGTRSTTDGDDSSDGGEEIGTDVENNINEVLLILARQNDNGLIAYTIVPEQKIIYSPGAEDVKPFYTATAKFFENALDDYYADATTVPQPGQNRDVNVFVVCNPNRWILDELQKAQYGSTDWTDAHGEVTVNGQQTEGVIWSGGNGGNFLMSNSRIATRQIPAALAAWDSYTTEDKCFHLSDTNGTGENVIDNSAAGNGGAIDVQRAAARFDFRDGSPSGTPANTYNVVFLKDGSNKDDTDKPVVSVTLNKMALVNMANAYYYFKRVSANGMPADAQLCSPEKPWVNNAGGNYVVSYYNGKTGYTIPLEGNYSNFFNYPFFNEDGSIDNTSIQNGDRWGTVRIEDVLKSTANDASNTYKIWRYCTENAIPAGSGPDPSKNEVNGNSTGIVFKARINGNEELLSDATVDESVKDLIRTLQNIKDGNSVMSDFLGNTNTDPILYSFNGLFYVTWPNVVKAAIKASFSYHYTTGGEIVPEWNRANSLYKAVFGDGGTGYTFTENGKTYTDTMPLDPNAPNSMWTAWDHDGRPATGDAHDNFKSSMTAAGFTLYQSSNDADQGWGYYCYYYYWNRHNDNLNNGVMGPMEFAVVRNNVYKLAVTGIHAVGHPRISENDPDKPTPDTPDEDTKLYLTVQCRVLPWVVRVNNIVFD